MGADTEAGALLKRRAAPWKKASGLQHVVSAWQEEPRIWRNVALFHRIAPQSAIRAELPHDLHPNILGALRSLGVESLHSHQREAIASALTGRHTVIATPTASGKSLCFHVPVMHALREDPSARALYLFPTKALCRDQESSLRRLLDAGGVAEGAITYDGDTPGDARRAAREGAGILLTNPDMLHAGVLPHHTLWSRFFSNLKYVVIDELHTYRGVFGSHLSNVLRRLQRIASFHGSSPAFLFASATIGNPKEHAEAMCGHEVTLVDRSGAPRAERLLMVYNPPVVNAELGIRESYVKAAVRLAGDLALANVPTLIFGQSRNNVEVMLKYLRDRLARERRPTDSVQGYRGGYLPKTRREIETGLREGRVRCVVATNALELGIDVGSLDAVICAGYPGSLAALHQRFGRGGRREGTSLSVLVTSSAPLDQFLANDPQYLIEGPVEQARIDPDNPEILIQHLKCATFEMPFAADESFGSVAPSEAAEALDMLAQHGVVHRAQGERPIYHWIDEAYPANHVSLRSIGWDNFTIIDVATKKTIAEMDWRSTHTMLHEQAIYQHEGRQYQVERLDFDNHKAFVRKVEPDYFTDAVTHTQVNIMDEDASDVMISGASASERGSTSHCVEAFAGDVSVVEKVVGYKKIKYHTHENVGYGDVRLPDMQMHTSAFWITFRDHWLEKLPYTRATVVDAIRGFANALHTVAALGLMTDPRDLGKTVGQPAADGTPTGPSSDAIYDPTVFLFDRMPGGIGLAPQLFVERHQLVERALANIRRCECHDGCPACIGPALQSPTHQHQHQHGAAKGSGSGSGRKARVLALWKPHQQHAC